MLKGHGAPIWDVAIYPGHGTYLSASGDKTIRLWKDGEYFNNTINADCRLLHAFRQRTMPLHLVEARAKLTSSTCDSVHLMK